MNYLAHLYLSGDSEGVIIGNFIADAVKGTQINRYSEEIRKGISWHRKIDSFTDKHEIVRQSKNRLMPEYHKYSAVIVDVFYDHFLAADWEKYSTVSLRFFCDSVYAMLEKKCSLFPLKSQQFLRYLAENDILFNYKNMDGIEKALKGLSYRARFNSNMHFAHRDLLKDYDLYKREFEIFFSDLGEYYTETEYSPKKITAPAVLNRDGNRGDWKQSITPSLPTP